MNRRRRIWRFVVLAIASLAGVVFGYMGLIMASSFSGATTYPPPPGHVEYWEGVANRYLVVVGLSAATLVVALFVLWRRRAGIAPSDSGQQAA